MQRTLILTAFASAVVTAAAIAQQPPKIDDARIDKAIAASWTKVPDDWKTRFVPDETIRACNSARGLPTPEASKAISARAQAAIEYPADGKFVGDWKKGEALAQSGYGLRFTDTDTTRPNGGNCYACHQIDKKELSFGTVGPSLTEYGRIRKFREADIKAVYEKIYNPHVVLACSNMPRFGASGMLTIEQIRDLVALLMDPESPVNK